MELPLTSRLVTVASVAGLVAAGAAVAGPAQAAAQPSFTYANGWRVDQHVRELADVNGDGRADVVGFGHRGIHVAGSIPTPPRNINFSPTALEVADFGVAQGWRVDRHPRALADLTGDGVADVVGFGNAGTWISDGSADPLTGPRLLTPEFGHNTGWTPQRYPRLLGDVNGDGRADIVAFGHSRLSVRLS
ncbi:FG-GAP repeat domain-containing protein [Kocuria sp. M4R2S49]|uniref:FG-GAP repeat domain-containing protein n=1 Tax=Kocuria rhizosphaericola TaxID=3376284 RepID=UPI00379AA888